MTKRLALLVAVFALLSPVGRAADAPVQVSGVYPHLAAFNEHGECGIGAVVPWAGKLWSITYPPHFRTGSTDKLYEIDPGTMKLTIRPESVGGTHANRMIHRESNQLVIGPYFISDKGEVRAADVKKLVGRLTATMRHLSDPANKVYFFDMEGPIWEVDVKTLEPKRVWVKPVPGWHGKGAYTGQGVLVVANNGEHEGGGLNKADWEAQVPTRPTASEDAGALAEWNGQPGVENWKVISRRQHLDVSGPGGIRGATNDADPLWSMGWDKRSILLHVRDAKTNAWQLYRLPKASHTYDPKHGWYTEWPRIREIGGDRYMMTVHGMMYDFPKTFAVGSTAGLRPINSYLRYIPDFCNWDGRIVLASDDTSIMQNPMAGISQSNYWFGTPEQLKDFGPASGFGGVWVGDAAKAGQASDPYLLAGFAKRVLHVSHKSAGEVAYTVEVDEKGDGRWAAHTTIKVPANGYAYHVFPETVKGEWVRIVPDKDAQVSAYFHYATPSKHDGSERGKLFAGLADAKGQAFVGGIVRPGKNKNLQFVARSVDASGQAGPEVAYEVDETLKFTKAGAEVLDEVKKVASVAEPVFTVDAASAVITTKTGRLRLPKGASFGQAGALPVRSLREVASERTLAHVAGTFYEVPRSESNTASSADWKNLKPVASHDLAITDYCVWRGLLVMTGAKADAKPDGQYFKAADSDQGLWFGAIDDLWKLGKPRGVGGVWAKTAVKANEASDPYLMLGFDKKRLELSHDAAEAVAFTVEVDTTNTGNWKPVMTVAAEPGKTTRAEIADGVNAYWVRVKADKACTATATFVYE